MPGNIDLIDCIVPLGVDNCGVSQETCRVDYVDSTHCDDSIS